MRFFPKAASAQLRISLFFFRPILGLFFGTRAAQQFIPAFFLLKIEEILFVCDDDQIDFPLKEKNPRLFISFSVDSNLCNFFGRGSKKNWGESFLSLSFNESFWAFFFLLYVIVVISRTKLPCNTNQAGLSIANNAQNHTQCRRTKGGNFSEDCRETTSNSEWPERSFRGQFGSVFLFHREMAFSSVGTYLLYENMNTWFVVVRL